MRRIQDFFDINEISRNVKTSSGGFVDYVLKTDEKKIYLEVKPLSNKLTRRNQIQATNYAYEDNIHFCILSNGNRYQIFETFKKGSVSDRLLIDISLIDDEIPIQKKVEIMNFISKSSVKTGNLEKINEILNIKNKVKEAIQTIFSNPNDKFIKVISSEIGENFEKEKIKNEIIEIGNEISFQESKITDSASKIELQDKKSSKEIENGIKILIDKLPDFQDIFLSLRNKILKLGNDIREVFMPQYNAIGFRRDTEFTSMKVKPKNREIEFLLKFGEFEPNMNNISEIEIEPIPKTYRYGKMNSKMSITREEQVDDAIKTIKQCYDLQLKWRK